MRLVELCIAAALMGAVAQEAGAADPASTRLPGSAPTLAAGFVSEARLGVTAHDPWSPESGSANLTGEVLFAKPVLTDPVLALIMPRLHLGASLNLSGSTSFAYAGLTWTFDLTPRFFVEASFGGALHTGETSAVVPADRNALGCSPLFRESASIGYRLSTQWSIMASVEHLSNGGLCSHNRGLTNVGARLGYTF